MPSADPFGARASLGPGLPDIYRVGAVDFMTLVDAQMTVNRYREELHALLAGYGRLIAELEMTIGRAIPAAPPTLAEER